MAAFVLLATGSPASARDDQVDCASLRLMFADDGYTQICYAGEQELLSDTGDLHLEQYEEIIAYGAYGAPGKAFQLRLISQSAPPDNSSLHLSIEEYVADRGWFTKTKNWEVERDVEGFRVQLFQGTWPGVGGFVPCAALLREASDDASSGTEDRTTGGFFCYSVGGDHLISSLKPFLASIRY